LAVDLQYKLQNKPVDLDRRRCCEEPHAHTAAVAAAAAAAAACQAAVAAAPAAAAVAVAVVASQVFSLTTQPHHRLLYLLR
jgi:hypothetical protein